jgi:hypothetical protein
MDRKQKLSIGEAVLSTRICRMSLGVVCSLVYNPDRHQGQPTYRDPHDKKTKVRRQVDWMIKAVFSPMKGDVFFELTQTHREPPSAAML